MRDEDVQLYDKVRTDMNREIRVNSVVDRGPDVETVEWWVDSTGGQRKT